MEALGIQRHWQRFGHANWTNMAKARITNAMALSHRVSLGLYIVDPDPNEVEVSPS